MDQFNRYRSLVSHLADASLTAAESALGEAEQASASFQPGEVSLGLLLPVARVILNDSAPDDAALLAAAAALARCEPSSGAFSGRLVTLLGQSRPMYHPFAVHLLLRALEHRGSAMTPIDREQIQAAASEAAAVVAACHARTPREGQQVALLLWQALCLIEAHAVVNASETAAAQAAAAVEHVVREGQGDGPLHRQHPDDQLDAWTYRELVGLHALSHLAHRLNRDDWRKRVAAVAEYHLEHTQPDYTTYEPWGVPAFMQSPETLIFVDQQLHDVSTNVQLSGGASALLPGLLLADAKEW